MCLFVYSSASWMVVVCTEAESKLLSAFWLITSPNKFLFDLIFYTSVSPRILRKQKENYFENPQALHSSSVDKKLLRDVISGCCLRQHWSLGAPLLPGDPGSLPRLRDAADTFPFAGSTSSEAERCPRDTHTRTHRHLPESRAHFTHSLAAGTRHVGCDCSPTPATGMEPITCHIHLVPP